MWNDTIIKEIKEIRKKYASGFNHDLDAIYEDILKRQEKSEKKRVSFPPKKITGIVMAWNENEIAHKKSIPDEI